MNKKLILSIETSCDETAAAVLEITSPNLSLKKERNNTKIPLLAKEGLREVWPQIKTLSSVVKSQISIHKSFGGVVPEAAARAHVKYIRPVVEQALSASRLALSTIDYIAVTHGPGLLPSLLVGVEFAKALSFATGKPLIPVNHMLGHLYSPFGKIGVSASRHIGSLFPMISLIVSGGHTMIVLQKNIKNYKVLGQTVDDAAGEAFDKVAKMLNLPYPGGPEVSRLAADGNPKAINFPRPMINDKSYNFSFSGLKTAVLYYLRAKGQGLGAKSNSLSPTRLALSAKADICASFQQAAVDVLVAKTFRAVKEFKAKSVSLSGGVAANALLRNKLQATCLAGRQASRELQANFFAPAKNLCTDNAEMIGLAAAFMLKNGFKPKSYKTIKANPNLQL